MSNGLKDLLLKIFNEEVIIPAGTQITSYFPSSFSQPVFHSSASTDHQSNEENNLEFLLLLFILKQAESLSDNRGNQLIEEIKTTLQEIICQNTCFQQQEESEFLDRKSWKIHPENMEKLLYKNEAIFMEKQTDKSSLLFSFMDPKQ